MDRRGTRVRGKEKEDGGSGFPRDRSFRIPTVSHRGSRMVACTRIKTFEVRKFTTLAYSETDILASYLEIGTESSSYDPRPSLFFHPRGVRIRHDCSDTWGTKSCLFGCKTIH